jgi:hypothetical protein
MLSLKIQTYVCTCTVQFEIEMGMPRDLNAQTSVQHSTLSEKTSGKKILNRHEKIRRRKSRKTASFFYILNV